MINMTKNKKLFIFSLFIFLISIFTTLSSAEAYFSRFDVINFKPAVDDSDYFTVYSSQTMKPGQAHLGFHFDYSDKPLQFVATGAATGKQSVVDKYLVADFNGAYSINDWFEVGLSIPTVVYNWYFTDDASATKDAGGGMGDMMATMKIRLADTSKGVVGFALRPFITLPSGDFERYMGSGHVVAGMDFITDFVPSKKFSLSLNIGSAFRDDVVIHGIEVADQFRYGVGIKYSLTENFNLIAETFGNTVMKSFFSDTNTTPMEAGGGMRYYFGNSGFAFDLGLNGGVLDGIGSPNYRIYTALTWLSSYAVPTECPVCAPPAPPPPPDPRIKDGKIVIWGKIYYDTDKAVIKPISYIVLDDVVDVLQKNPQLKLVEVQGHCDARASDKYNLKLSDERAKAALAYLVNKGIDASRLVAKGYGESKPAADNKTKEGMSQNRRTEFVILQQDPL